MQEDTKVDIKSIETLSLTENDVLVATIDGTHSREAFCKLGDDMQAIINEHFPFTVKLIVMPDNIKLSKVVAEDATMIKLRGDHLFDN